jgi:hypothetical protein
VGLYSGQAELLGVHDMGPLTCCLSGVVWLQCELVRYDDPDQELATTDLAELEGKPRPQLQPEGEHGGWLAWNPCCRPKLLLLPYS